MANYCDIVTNTTTATTHSLTVHSEILPAKLLNEKLRECFDVKENVNTAGIYQLQVNSRNTRTRCKICSKLTIKTPERHQSGVFIVNFEHISPLVLMLLLLTLSS